MWFSQENKRNWRIWWSGLFFCSDFLMTFANSPKKNFIYLLSLLSVHYHVFELFFQDLHSKFVDLLCKLALKTTSISYINKHWKNYNSIIRLHKVNNWVRIVLAINKNHKQVLGFMTPIKAIKHFHKPWKLHNQSLYYKGMDGWNLEIENYFFPPFLFWDNEKISTN